MNFLETHTGLLSLSLRLAEVATCSLHYSTLSIALFQESHLISYWPMKQQWVRGKWAINLCNVIRGWSTVSKCLRRQPSKLCSQTNWGERESIQGKPLFLLLPLSTQHQGIKSIIFQRSVHFSYRPGFYVLCTPAQGRTAVWALHPL